MFYRDFRFLTGGHLKVWHYFGHVRASSEYTARIRFSRSSVMDDSNPWSSVPETMARRLDRPDVYFVAGLDWRALPPAWRRRKVPVINLIQHVRHAEDCDPRRPYLRNPAVRVCVSEEVASAVAATGEVRGPLLTIPNAIDVQGVEVPAAGRDLDVLIAGLKQPDLARSISAELPSNLKTRVLTERVPHREFLTLLASARVVVLLPGRTEGFFLPALEAMALGALVVCPDCVGNRSFCIDGVTAWMPAFRAAEIVAATHQALSTDSSRAASVHQAATAMADRHSLESERRAFYDILDRLPELWERALRDAV
jgi:glycosyltransferase involved in cell wall biosynthesis